MAGTGDAYDFATLEASGVADVALSLDQTLLYAAMRNGDINVYNLITRQKIATWDVGIQLGGLSLSTDGSFLLVTERNGANNGTANVDTATGAATTIVMAGQQPGQAFRDVEIVDNDTAILTGAASSLSNTIYNLTTGQFAALPGAVYYSGWGTVLAEDKHLTLLAEPGISSGPMFLFDDRTNSIVASGTNYQTISTSNNTGFNFGSQAVSEAGGLVAQFIGRGINFYDLHLVFLKTVLLGELADGLVFDPSGKYIYAYLIESGVVAKYDVASWTRVDEFNVGVSSWHNDVGYGSQLLLSSDGTRLTIVDTNANIGKLRIVDLTVRNERFEGTAGADALGGGGKGDDVYVVNDLGDSVTELAHEGEDTVETSLSSYTLGANLERLTGISASGQTLSGNAAANVITGGPGDDFLLGGAGNDVIHGMGGNDILRGDDGDDQLFGDDGGDLMRGGRGVDSFDGGANDTLPNLISTYGDRVSFFDLAATQGAVANLNTGIISNDGFGNAETMVNVESLGGDTAFVDTFYGNNNSNALLGSRGDNLYGSGGDDVIYLSAAAALADGGAGNDVLVLQSDAPWYLPDSNGDGFAELAPAMTTGWTVELDIHRAEDGYGNSGTIQGFEGVVGSELDDIIWGDLNANVLKGMGGDDVIFGDGGNDTIEGGEGFDLLHGLDGDDSLSGGGGNDLMRGYAGTDSYDGGAEDGLDPEFTGYGDRVSFFDPRATQAVVADLRTGIVSNDGYGNVETLVNVESLGAGTAFADTFYGNDSINNLLGSVGDFLYGFGGDDIIQLRGASAVTDGGGGIDLLQLSTLVDYRPDSNGDGVAELGPTMTAGYFVDLAAGTVRDGNGITGSVAGIENVTGTELADEIRGDGGDNRIEGGGGIDQLRSGTGTDTLLGGGDTDVLYFGGSFTGADVADGGSGRDVLVLQGNYTLTLSSTNLTAIESISLQTGANTRWGDTANNFYDYNITMANANVPAGVQLIVNGQSLRVGEDFTFDGSAETDGGMFLVYGGHGVDILKGGSGNDVFFFEGARFQPGDSVDGGAGRDAIVISSGSGVNRFEFSDASFTGIESISLNNRFTSDPSQKPSYELVLANGNVVPGATLIVNGSSLSDPAQTVSVDGSDIHDGKLILFSGAGGDTLIGGDGADLFYGAGGRDHLTGGGGADNFQYRAVSDSLPWNDSDFIHDFQGGIDKIDLSLIDADTTAPGDQAFTFIGSAQFSNHAGELRAVDLGQNMWLIMADVDGDSNADFTTQADLHLNVIRTDSTPMLGSDFIL
jgi:Ca2+-binding RTX toxin-like protein